MLACQICGQHFSRESSLKRHQRTFHGSEQHRCVQCYKVYARRDNLRKHQNKRHPATDNHPKQLPAHDIAAEQEVQQYQIDSPLDIVQAVRPIVATEPFEATVQQANVNHHTLNNDLTVEFPISAEALSEGFDFLGRIDCEPLAPLPTNVPSPTFLLEAVQALQDRFPNAKIQSEMHLYAVHRRTLVPVLRTLQQQDCSDLVTFKFQYVPTITCNDCKEELFPIVPYYGVGEVEDHLHSPTHARRMRFREIAESPTAREFMLIVAGAPVILTALANLSNGKLSLIGLNEDYFVKTGQTLLILAVKNAEIHVLRHLLDEDLSITGRDWSRRSALHWACALGRFDMAELLVRYNARLDLLDENSESALDLAIKVNGVNTAVALIEAEARAHLEKSPKWSDTALALACRYGHLAIVEAMVANGVNVNEGACNSPLEVAIRKASSKVVRTLLMAGAKVESISNIDCLQLIGKGADNGMAYPDSKEKISLLKRYGLCITSTGRASLHPWR